MPTTLKSAKELTGPKSPQSVIDFVGRWLNYGNCTFNEKTRLLMTEFKNQTRMTIRRINCELLNRAEEARDLGYNVSSELRFSLYCRVLVKTPIILSTTSSVFSNPSSLKSISVPINPMCDRRWDRGLQCLIQRRIRTLDFWKTFKTKTSLGNLW